MTSNSFYTVDDTSEISEKVHAAIHSAVEFLPSDRSERIRNIRIKIKNLDDRGLLKRQAYKSPTTGEFERMVLRAGGLAHGYCGLFSSRLFRVSDFPVAKTEATPMMVVPKILPESHG